MKTIKQLSVPHPFPYQGSKRNIAKHILPYFPSDVDCLIEPFCGAGAISIAACTYNLTKRVLLNDLNEPLMALWGEILARPERLADKYEKLWHEQQADKKAYFFLIRDKFNEKHQPDHLLYLLARIVKGAVRYSSTGKFNQSADNRRSGMKPITMRKNILSVHHLLSRRTSIQSVDFREIILCARENDLVYMDPPYQGTSFTRDHRYLNGLSFNSFVDALSMMNKKNISYIISYDGITGKKVHGKLLPSFLSLTHLYIDAGRSSQATLLGGNDKTVESLYLSPALTKRLEESKSTTIYPAPAEQLSLVFA